MTDATRLLVPLDFSDGNPQVVSFAWDMAEQLSAEVHFLHVLPPAPRGAPFPGARDEAFKMLQGLSGLPRGVNAGPLNVRHLVREGAPVDEILKYAREISAGAIIMGTRARRGIARVMLGSVAEAVLRQAACRVLIVGGQDSQSPMPPVTADDSDSESNSGEPVEELLAQGTDSNRVVELLKRAALWRATDVHIDPVEHERVSIRFRVDGKLRTFCHLDASIAAPLLMQLKLMADFDTTQSFEPQEGRLRLPPELERMEVRITIVPACGGDAVALRLLSHQAHPRSLSTLGMSPASHAAVHRMLHSHEGLVLVTGPTGTGKTTTVYAMLQLLDTGDRNIVSIEDPVEFRVPSIRQLSINPRHNLTMSRGLRTLLRMDPDVVFIGEIRDVETLDIAMRASSSGRYVFSTLHTRNVASTVTALRDLHADNYSLAGNLSGIVCQRLMRCLCTQCRQAVPVTDEQCRLFLAEQLDPPAELFEPRGCPACQNMGYRDRIGVFEVVLAEGAVSAAIQRGAAEDELEQIIRDAGVPSLAADALMKARDGLTSLEEARSIGWV